MLWVLGGLPYLCNLAIGQGSYRGPLNSAEIKTSFTDQVLQNLDPLTALTIWDEPHGFFKQIITGDMMRAISRHRDTLEYLDVKYYGYLNQDFYDEALYILSNFNLKDVDMTFTVPKHSKHPNIPSLLSKTVERCEISIDEEDNYAPCILNYYKKR